MNNEMVT